MPDGVVAACGLAVGVALDRPLLRTFRRELRDAEAMAAAGRVLRRRDTSRRTLEERLTRTGVAPDARERTVATLARVGVVDDVRFAKRRAAALAERGWGDAAIRDRLEGEGVNQDAAEAALAQLPPERERARRLLARIPDARKAWSYLGRRGFDPETIAEAAGPLDERDAGGLG